MSKSYDNWERLVRAVLDREHFRELCLLSSRSCSNSSSRSSTSATAAVSSMKIDHWEWNTMLPRNKQEVALKSASMRSFLDSETGKNCFMLGARQLQFSPGYSDSDNPDSRFTDVAKIYSSKIFIGGRIKAQVLSRKTLYAAYLVYRKPEERTASLELDFGSAITTCKLVKGAKQGIELILRHKDLKNGYMLAASCRDDGWMEIEMGDCYVDEEDKGEVEAWLLKVSIVSPIVVEGIEFRPKYTEPPLMSRGKCCN